MNHVDLFWKEYTKQDSSRLHLCDIPEEIFYARHKNVLKLIPKYKAEEIGLFIAGKYYSEVWASRSCSGYLAYLVGIDNRNSGAYINFYCSSSVYFFSKHSLNPAYTAFEEADKLDNRMG